MGWTIEQWLALGGFAALAVGAKVWSIRSRRRMEREHREVMREVARVLGGDAVDVKTSTPRQRSKGGPVLTGDWDIKTPPRPSEGD